MDKKDFVEWVTKLHSTYKPNATVSEKLKRLHLVAVVGPTGVGKTTLIQTSGIPYIVGDVTRPTRPGERNGHEYHFREDYLEVLQQIKAGEYAQFVINASGEFYGTRGSSYPDDGFCTMAIFAAAVPQFQSLGFKQMTLLYILPPSYVEWMRRIGKERAGDLQSRLGEARVSLPKALADPNYHFILNDTVESALGDIKTILAGSPVNEHRATLARQTAELLIGRLGEAV